MVSGSLPDDVMMDILSRLAAKSLLRFRCVHKSWSSLIKSSSFVKNHHEKHEAHGLIYVIYHDYSLDNKRVYDDLAPRKKRVRLLSHDTNDDLSDFLIPFNSCFSCLKIVGSCHGLVCLYEFVDINQIFLHNPSLREHRILPESTLSLPKNAYVSSVSVVGFGYDSLTDDYKVIIITTFYDKEIEMNANRNRAEVYSLGMNSWKEIGVMDCFDHLYNKQAFVNGAAHWLGREKINVAIMGVLAFDVTSEEFQWFQLPSCIFKLRDRNLYQMVDVYCGFLSVIYYYDIPEIKNDSYLEIWAMKEYGVQDSWDCFVRIADPYSSYVEKNLLGFGKNGEFLMKDYKRGRLVVFDAAGNCYDIDIFEKNFEEHHELFFLEPVTCTESLVSISRK